MTRLMAVAAGLLLWTGCEKSSTGPQSSTGSPTGGVDDTARSGAATPGSAGSTGTTTTAIDGGYVDEDPARSMTGVAAEQMGEAVQADGGVPK